MKIYTPFTTRVMLFDPNYYGPEYNLRNTIPNYLQHQLNTFLATNKIKLTPNFNIQVNTQYRFIPIAPTIHKIQVTSHKLTK